MVDPMDHKLDIRVVNTNAIGLCGYDERTFQLSYP